LASSTEPRSTISFPLGCVPTR